MKDPELDLFEWGRELAARRTAAQPQARPMDVDYGARKEVGKDGLSRAPLDGDRYVRAKKGQSGPSTKKGGGAKEPVDESWMYDGE